MTPQETLRVAEKQGKEEANERTRERASNQLLATSIPDLEELTSHLISRRPLQWNWRMVPMNENQEKRALAAIDFSRQEMKKPIMISNLEELIFPWPHE
mmetsp:Transcript_21661/g.46363  ORF Transcript_21661/g.46363 Transcript_21661/m.46363 type:complete len:99 (+) Transcript_21661:1855-2151(+)